MKLYQFAQPHKINTAKIDFYNFCGTKNIENMYHINYSYNYFMVEIFLLKTTIKPRICVIN